MTDRPCNQCIWLTEDGCSSWDCEPMTRKDVRNLIKKVKELEKNKEAK